jgi:hypothetical protein
MYENIEDLPDPNETIITDVDELTDSEGNLYSNF